MATALERTYWLGEELERIPALRRTYRPLRAVLSTVAVLLAVVAFVVPLWLTRSFACFFLVLPLPFVPALAARLARRLLWRRLQAAARGAIDPARLARTREGQPVSLRGRVSATRALPDVEGKVVIRRLEVALLPLGSALPTSHLDPRVGRRHPLVHERGEPFDLVAEDGSSVRVDPSEVVLWSQPAPAAPMEASRLARLVENSAPEEVQRLLLSLSERSFECREVRVCEGDVVQVIGIKGRFLDPDQKERLPRDAPIRDVVRGTDEMPLLMVTKPADPARANRPAIQAREGRWMR